MVYVWGPAVIGGIVAGGALFLFFSIGLLVVVGLRIRHRRKLAAINAAGERRLSRHPGGNLRISDEEFSQVPCSKSFLQRSVYNPYGPPNAWTAIPSRESIHARPVTRSPLKAVALDCSQQQTDPSNLSWPLPRRLTRSEAIPLKPVKKLPLSPITERSATHPEQSPAIMLPTGFPTQGAFEQSTDKIGQALSGDCSGGPQPGKWPVVPLKPRPLFHGHQRSLSAESIPQVPAEHVSPAFDNAANPRDSFPFGSRKLELPRSVSLGSQSSGIVPDAPVPPLPANARKSSRPDKVRVNATGSPSRPSGGSFASGNSSILQDRVSHSNSQAETDFTSLSLLSPISGLRIYDGSKIWDPSRMSSTPISPGPSASTSIRTQLLTLRSFRASIGGYSLPRSASSGLSMSLLDQHTPKAEPKTPGIESFSKGLPAFNSARNLGIPKINSIRWQSSRERATAGFTSNRNSLFNVYDDVRNKRASTSILSDVSGNQNSPVRSKLAKRPTSIATSNPYQWDPAKSMKPGQLAAHRGWRRGHKRQNCVRISNLTPRSTPGRFLPTVEEPDEQSHAFVHLSGPQTTHTQHRPPSQPTFNPIIRVPSRSPESTRPTGLEGPYSPTLTMVNLYSPLSESSESSTENSTPTRKPSQRRRNLLTSNPKPPTFPSFSLPSTTPLTALPPSPPPPTATAPSPPSPPTPLSPILHFPPPPLGLPPSVHPPSDLHHTHSTRTPIRGPRAPLSPTRGPRATASSPSRAPSPTRTQTTRAEKRLSPLRDLRKSVMALRRMNSEVSESEARACRRYLRMGVASPLLDDFTLGKEGSLLFRENSVRSGLGGDGAVRSGLGSGGEVIGGLVIEEEGEGGGLKRMERVERELRRLREVYAVREKEGEGEGEGEKGGTLGGLYDEEGFLRE